MLPLENSSRLGPGPYGLSARAVCAKIDVSPTAYAVHFRSAPELIAAVATEAVEQLVRQLGKGPIPAEGADQIQELLVRAEDAAKAAASLAHGLVGEFIDEGLGRSMSIEVRLNQTRKSADVLLHGLV